MARVPKESETFFRLSPAADGKAQCFAVRRGVIAERADVIFHQPWVRARLALLEKAKHPATNLGEFIQEIRYGTGTPPPYLEQSPETVPFVRATDIKDNEINTKTLLHISNEQPKSLAKCRLAGGELIIVRSGVNTGDCAVVPSSLAGAFAAYDLILTFKPSVSPQFVSTFLDTEIGRLQLNLVKGRAAQPHINAAEVSALRIPRIEDRKEQDKLVTKIADEREKRRAKLAKADALLSGLDNFIFDALGLVKPAKDERKIFAVPSVSAIARFDPHFHLPAHAQNFKTLAAHGGVPLGTLANFSDETWNPEKHEAATFRYIEISTVNTDTGEASATETPVSEAPSRARMAVSEGDIIVSLTRPHHGAIAQITPDLNDCVASTGFSVIRGFNRVSRDYLWCILRSEMCLSQMLQRASGGNYPAITEPELLEILIPVPKPAVQETIAAEVRHRRDTARQLHAEAEAGWQAAKRWFEDQLLGNTNPA